MPEFEKRGVRLVATSIDPPEDLATMREASEASFPFLSDPEGELIDLFDIRHGSGRMDGADIAQSATFLVDPDGRVLWRRIADNYRQRPEPAEILAAIDRLP